MDGDTAWAIGLACFGFVLALASTVVVTTKALDREWARTAAESAMSDRDFLEAAVRAAGKFLVMAVLVLSLSARLSRPFATWLVHAPPIGGLLAAGALTLWSYIDLSYLPWRRRFIRTYGHVAGAKSALAVRHPGDDGLTPEEETVP